MSTRRNNNNNNLIFQMNMENPRILNQNQNQNQKQKQKQNQKQKPNQNKNKKRNNTKKVNRKLSTVYANKYVNKPSLKQPFAPINQKTIQNMNKYYKNTPF